MKRNWFVIFLVIAGVVFTGVIFCASAYESSSYYPKGTTPTHLYVIAESDMTPQERVMIATLQGLLAKTSATGIWIEPTGNHADPYSTWLSYLNSEYGVEYETKTDPWWLLDHFKLNIDGLFFLEYSRYNSYKGTIVWSNNKPVISAREMLWWHLDELIVIDHINSAPRDPCSADGYTLVVVHPWSKSLSDVQTVINGLASDVRVVTPEVFVKLIAENVEH